MPFRNLLNPRSALVAFAATMLLASAASAQDAQLIPTTEDLIGPIRERVASPDKPFDIFIDITIKPGLEGDFERAFAPAVNATRREPGNIAFQLTRDPRQPNVYVHHERWRTLRDVEQHMEMPHMKAFWPVYLPMLARTPEFHITETRELTGGQ